jgi:hypothetical protein
MPEFYMLERVILPTIYFSPFIPSGQVVLEYFLMDAAFSKALSFILGSDFRALKFKKQSVFSAI